MATIGSREFLTELNREQRELALRTWPYLAGYVAVLCASYVALDVYFPDSATLFFWAAMFGWAGNYVLLVLLLQHGRLLRAGQGSGVGTYVVVGLATGIPIALGFIVVIVPGLYLLMRWLPVYARARAVNDWTGNAMRWSWRATEPFQKPLGIALIGPTLCYAGSYAPYILYDLSITIPDWLSIALIDLLMPIGSTWLTVLGVASYAMVVAIDGGGREVGVD